MFFFSSRYTLPFWQRRSTVLGYAKCKRSLLLLPKSPYPTGEARPGDMYNGENDGENRNHEGAASDWLRKVKGAMPASLRLASLMPTEARF